VKCPANGISVPRGPIREPGGDLLAGTFWKKYIRILFLDLEDIEILSLGTLVKGQGSPELILDYGA
jgi:hypothetical protein